MTTSNRLNIGAVRCTFAPWEDPVAKPLIRFEGVVKRFGDDVAVNGVSLDIYEKEFFALLGPSGCGKTTLMRMLAGFETPNEGRITLEGEDILAKPAHKRPVNMMFQSYALFPHLNVEQNIAFGLKHLPKDERTDRVLEMLALVRLEGLARRKPDQLSGGQRQRVALARAIAPRPRLLLLDEPLAALDKTLRDETQFELVALQERLGMTFMVVTHDQEEAMVMSTRVAVMDKGQIVQVGRPSEVYETPNSRYVADFIGEVNLFEAKVTSANGVTMTLAGENCPAGYAVLEDDLLAPGVNVTLAVRPEKIQVSQDRPPAGANGMAGKVADIGYLGDWTTYLVTVPGGMTVRAARANSARIVERPIDWDDEVWLTFSPDAAVVLTS